MLVLTYKCIYTFIIFCIDTHLIQWTHPAYHVIQLNRKWCYIVWNFVMGDMYVYWLNNTHIHTTHYQSGLGNYVTTFLINAHALLFSSCVITWRLLTFIWNITKKKKGQFQDKLILSQRYFTVFPLRYILLKTCVLGKWNALNCQNTLCVCVWNELLNMWRSVTKSFL